MKIKLTIFIFMISCNYSHITVEKPEINKQGNYVIKHNINTESWEQTRQEIRSKMDYYADEKSDLPHIAINNNEGDCKEFAGIALYFLINEYKKDCEYAVYENIISKEYHATALCIDGLYDLDNVINEYNLHYWTFIGKSSFDQYLWVSNNNSYPSGTYYINL